jgi:hypothetical protein
MKCLLIEPALFILSVVKTQQPMSLNRRNPKSNKYRIAKPEFIQPRNSLKSVHHQPTDVRFFFEKLLAVKKISCFTLSSVKDLLLLLKKY